MLHLKLYLPSKNPKYSSTTSVNIVEVSKADFKIVIAIIQKTYY